jgi:peptidoglycan/LPS O-acetylase OafA/YrhL
MQYRKEIDGLRSIAVLPVIFFYAGLSIFSGGYVGVDIFFVISGYLITSIIISETNSGNFSLINFYERRARRILPALYFVIIVCLPFAWFWMMPFQLRDFSGSIVSVVFFVSNIFFWKKSGYFQPEAEDNPLLHTWSLGVEEQYYLLFPLLVIIFWRYGFKSFFYLLVVITFSSLIAAEYFSRLYPSANFYLASTRVWELLTGSLVVLILWKKRIKENEFFSFIGLILILISIFIFDEHTRFPSFYALLPVVGTALIILFSSSETLVGKLLSARALVFVGLLSYSDYLWHQPIFAFARLNDSIEQNIYITISFIALTFTLSFLSWKYVESILIKKMLFAA